MSGTVWPWKPLAVALTVYGPPVVRPLALNEPVGSVVMVVVAPVRVSVMTTVAPPIAAPDSFVTRPVMEVVICCANEAAVGTTVAANGTKRAAHERSKTAFFTEKLPRKQLRIW